MSVTGKEAIDRINRIKAAFVQIVEFADRREYVLSCRECGLKAMSASVFDAERLLAGHRCDEQKGRGRNV